MTAHCQAATHRAGAIANARRQRVGQNEAAFTAEDRGPAVAHRREGMAYGALAIVTKLTRTPRSRRVPR